MEKYILRFKNIMNIFIEDM